MPYSQGHSLDSVMEMLAIAAGTAVSNVVEMIGTVASPSVQNAAMKVQLYGSLPSLHLSPCQPSLHIAPTSSARQTCRPSPERIYTSLASQCLVSLCDGLAGYAIPLYNTLAVQKPPAGSPEPVRAPGPFDPSTLPETGPARVGPQTVRAMLDAGCPALLAALSFLLTTRLSDPLVGDVVGAAGARPRSGVPCTAHAARRVPHRAHESRLPTTHRGCAR